MSLSFDIVVSFLFSDFFFLAGEDSVYSTMRKEAVKALSSRIQDTVSLLICNGNCATYFFFFYKKITSSLFPFRIPIQERLQVRLIFSILIFVSLFLRRLFLVL